MNGISLPALCLLIRAANQIADYRDDKIKSAKSDSGEVKHGLPPPGFSTYIKLDK